MSHNKRPGGTKREAGNNPTKKIDIVITACLKRSQQLHLLIFNVIPVIPNIHRAVLVEVQHDMVELHSQHLFHLVLNLTKDGRVLIFHVYSLATVFQGEVWVGCVR
jgi:hypothetical protein